MRAYRVHGADHSELEEVAKPTPGAGEIIVRIGAAGLCHTDVELAQTARFMGATLPLTGGHEIAGWVDDVGSGVSGLSAGEAVAVYELMGCGRCRRCLGGEDNLCAGQQVYGVTQDGGLADFVKVRARDAFSIGDLDVVQAAVLTDAGLTSFGAVRHGVDLLRSGSVALVIGVGGLGHVAIQIIRALSPATVVAVDVDDTRLDLARRVGAHHAFLAGDDTASAIREVCAGPVDVVYDFVANGATIGLGCRTVRGGGAIALTGMGKGTFTLTTGFDSPVPAEVRITRTLGGSRRDLEDVIQLARTGRITATVSTYPLEQTGEQISRLGAGEVVGRSVIVP